MKERKITNHDALKRATISVNDFSQLIGISKITVYRQIESGKIPSFKIGSRCPDSL